MISILPSQLLQATSDLRILDLLHTATFRNADVQFLRIKMYHVVLKRKLYAYYSEDNINLSNHIQFLFLTLIVNICQSKCN